MLLHCSNGGCGGLYRRCCFNVRIGIVFGLRGYAYVEAIEGFVHQSPNDWEPRLRWPDTSLSRDLMVNLGISFLLNFCGFLLLFICIQLSECDMYCYPTQQIFYFRVSLTISKVGFSNVLLNLNVQNYLVSFRLL